MSGPPVTTIRTTPYPQPAPQPGVRPEADRMAAQRAFFAMLTGKTQAPAETAAAPVAVAEPPPRPTASAEAPTKILRPGSLIDIRV